jgi:uncharacterized membrane protein YoaK (UPF0700 family)
VPPVSFAIALPLASVGGFVDAVGFLTLAGLFVAHMSGNTVRLGVFVGKGEWNLAAQRVVPVVAFAVGVMLAVGFAEALRRRGTSAPAARLLGVELVLLLGFMFTGEAVLHGHSARGGSFDYYLLAVIVVLAMAVQTAALRRVAHVPVHTTFVTGVLTHLAEETVAALYARRDARRAGNDTAGLTAAATARREARLHGGVWIGYLGGGVVGALLALEWELWALAVPLAALVVMIVVDLRRPSTVTRP